MSFFFDDMAEAEAAAEGSLAAAGLAEEGAAFQYNDDRALPLDKRETLELVRAYYRIGDPAVRKRLFELTKALANLSGNRGSGEP